MMGRSPEDLRRDVKAVRDEMAACPSPEEMGRYLDGDLAEERSLLVEYHVNDCPACMDLLARLEASEQPIVEDDVYRKGRERARALVASRLGFENKHAQPAARGILGRLRSLRTPLYVPAGLAVLLACLVVGIYGGWFISPHPGSGETFLELSDWITVTQSITRDDGTRAEPTTVAAGSVIPIELKPDFLVFQPGDTIVCLVSDADGRELDRQELVVPDDYSIIFSLIFTAPGTYTVRFQDEKNDSPFPSRTIVATPADNP